MTASTRLYFYWFTLDLLVVYIRLILIYKNIIAKLWMLRPHSLLSYLFLLRCVLKARYKRKWPSLLVVMETSGPRRNNLKPVIESVQPAGAIDQISQEEWTSRLLDPPISGSHKAITRTLDTVISRQLQVNRTDAASRRIESIISFIIQSSLNLYSYSPIAAYNKKWREHRKWK